MFDDHELGRRNVVWLSCNTGMLANRLQTYITYVGMMRSSTCRLMQEASSRRGRIQNLLHSSGRHKFLIGANALRMIAKVVSANSSYAAFRSLLLLD